MTDAHTALIEATYAHGHLVRHAGYELEELANCAAMLGQERLASRLFAIQKELNQSFEALNAAHGNAVHQNLVEAEQDTTNMMRAVFAGIGIGEKGALEQ